MTEISPPSRTHHTSTLTITTRPGPSSSANSVDANGVSLVDGNTLRGLGGFKLANGVVYGNDGGIVNPATTPPSQIATLPTFSLYGGGATAPDPATGLDFLILDNLAGSFSSALTRYNTTQYVAEQMLPLPTTNDGSQVAYDMLRWGQDGLALRVYRTYPTPSTSHLLLFRGPFVLPAELSANPVPTLNSSSPATLAVNGGNTNITINGSNFLPGAIALWAGQPRTTTYVDSGHLSVAIPASDLASAHTVNLTAANPGSSASTPISLSIQ